MGLSIGLSTDRQKPAPPAGKLTKVRFALKIVLYEHSWVNKLHL